MDEYKSWPGGYIKLANRIIPFYMLPAKKMMMRLFLKILSEG